MRFETVSRAAVAAVAWISVLAPPGLAQQREYYIRGRVLGADKAPLPGVEVSLRDVGSTRRFDVTTDKQGVFKLAGLPHGVYDVAFTKGGYVPGQAKWNFETPQDSMQRVEVPDTVLVSQSQKQEAQAHKEANASVKEAAEKLRKGDPDGAIALVQGVLAKNPKDASALFIFGVGQNQKKKYADALAALSQVIELTPTFAPAHFELGTAHRRLGDLPKALASYDKSLELDPGNADAAFNAGLILFETGRIDEALARFERALAVRPADADILEMTARCYLNQAKFEKAVGHLEKARLATPDAAKIAFLDELIRQARAQLGR